MKKEQTTGSIFTTFRPLPPPVAGPEATKPAGRAAVLEFVLPDTGHIGCMRTTPKRSDQHA